MRRAPAAAPRASPRRSARAGRVAGPSTSGCTTSTKYDFFRTLSVMGAPPAARRRAPPAAPPPRAPPARAARRAAAAAPARRRSSRRAARPLPPLRVMGGLMLLALHGAAASRSTRAPKSRSERGARSRRGGARPGGGPTSLRETDQRGRLSPIAAPRDITPIVQPSVCALRATRLNAARLATPHTLTNLAPRRHAAADRRPPLVPRQRRSLATAARRSLAASSADSSGASTAPPPLLPEIAVLARRAPLGQPRHVRPHRRRAPRLHAASRRPRRR